MRIVDPTKFVLLGAVTDWLAAYRRQVEQARSPKEIAAERKLAMTRIVQLRWLLAPELGYPTEPFRVWRRPAMPMQTEKEVGYRITGLFTLRFVVLERPMVFVRVQLNAASAGALMAFSGMPYNSPMVALRPLAAGFRGETFELIQQRRPKKGQKPAADQQLTKTFPQAGRTFNLS